MNDLHFMKINLGLNRINEVAKRLDLLHFSSFIIIVGGTNGKGTTCCLLEKIFLANNITVGVYSSPHLLSYTERIRIQGIELSNVNHIKSMEIIEHARGSIFLSYFEFSTLSALYLFKQARVEIIILEVGLGGRLDATNIVDADVSVVTSISLDHVDILGSDYFSIAKEKAGIFRFNKPAVIGEPLDQIFCNPLINFNQGMLFIKDRDWWFDIDRTVWHWCSSNRILESLPLPSIPLNNAATALAVLDHIPLNISDISIRRGIQSAKLPGRFQVINNNPIIILDVAHNPQAANYLAKKIEQSIYIKGKMRAVVGMLSNKDIRGTLYCLQHLVDIWYCASLDTLLGANAMQLALYLSSPNISLYSDVNSAFVQAMSDSNIDDCILVFGSFYTVSPVIKFFIKNSCFVL